MAGFLEGLGSLALQAGQQFLAGQQIPLQKAGTQAKKLKAAKFAMQQQTTLGGFPLPDGFPKFGTPSEGISGSNLVPTAIGDVIPGITSGSGALAGDCPGPFSIRVAGQCVNLGDLGPGGPPAVTGQVSGATTGGNVTIRGVQYGPAIASLFGVGVVPRVEPQVVRRCPPGFALGVDGVCYEGLARNSKRRMWPLGQRPLLTGGERRAIQVAAQAGRRLETAKKGLKKAARTLEKAC